MTRGKPYILAALTAAILISAVSGRAETGDAIVKVFIDRLVDLVDGNGDGKVSKAEFDEARRIHFAAADQNGDGVVTRSEFIHLSVTEVGALSRPWTGPVFAAFDRNANGRLTKAEVSATADEIFAHADRDGNGTATADEIRPALAMAQ